ncbi:hypothetical protein ACH4C2_05915 [Streptomyces sp. NPDC018057]|uniref:hypothetical protein n=1 Tax=unclassified Streptomyces TaxID=2593676 RepID=UPI0037922EDB
MIECGTGVLCIAGVPSIVGGLGIAAAGYGTAQNGASLLGKAFSNASSQSSGSGGSSSGGSYSNAHPGSPEITTRYEKAGNIGNYVDGQKTRDPASQWYHEELSDEELLDGINNAVEGDGILVSRDGTILGGHHRKDEVLTRVGDGRIKPDTLIRVDVYGG